MPQPPTPRAKINGLYYFIYFSQESHELCYATSRYPDRVNFTANNHGNLECINGQWYIFYHRHTHNTTFSRQACAEPVTIEANGTIRQVECTTSGLNGPLRPKGVYLAPYCCNLTNGSMPHATNTAVNADIPYITHRDGERFVTNIMAGTKIGFKYFAFDGGGTVTVTTRGGKGRFTLTTDEAGCEVVAEICLADSESWQDLSASFQLTGLHALFFHYQGEAPIEFLKFTLS